jgi:hypothetical protein
MSKIRARLANDHDHYLDGKGSALAIRSNAPVIACPTFENQLLGSPWTVTSPGDIARNGNVFTGNGYMSSSWAAEGDFSITYKRQSGSGTVSTFYYGLLTDRFVNPSSESLFGLGVGSTATDDNQTLIKLNPSAVGNVGVGGGTVKGNYDLLYRTSRVAGVTKNYISSNCGKTFIEVNPYSGTNNSVVYAGLYTTGTASVIIVESVGFAPYVAPPAVISS